MNKFAMTMLSLALLSGCTSAPAPEEKPQPPELVTGRTAFQKLYISAHGWAADAKPYQLQSQVVEDHHGSEGRAVLWRAAFASQAQRSSRPYVWSGIDSPDAPARGVSPGAQDNFTPGNAFDVNFLRTDSDKAYQVAQKHGGAAVKGTPITYLLDWAPVENKLVWHVIYGPGRNDAKLIVDVDATTGEFLRKEK